MKIISHRGLWHAPEDRNTSVAFRATIDAGFGTEADVRDVGGELVVSHDPVTVAAMPWESLLDLFDGSGLPLAVNVKSDGLVPLLKAAFASKAIEWFAFDMSGPQTVQYAQADLPFYTRHSDVESVPVLYEAARGVWLDAFEHDWFDVGEVARHRAAGKAVCVVSPELHGRDHRASWQRLRAIPDDWDVTLCTDLPHAAREFFA